MRFIGFILMLLLPLASEAQNEHNARAVLPTRDSTDIKKLLDYAMSIAGKNRDSALFYVAFAYEKSQSINYKWGRAEAAHLLGTNEMRQGQFKKAEALYRESLDIFRSLKDSGRIALNLTVLGVNEGLQNHSAEALGWFLRAMRIYELGNDKEGLAEIYYKIGLVYGQVNDFEKALHYQNLSLQHAKTVGNKRMQMGVLTNIGMLQGKEKKYAEAIKTLYAARTLSLELNHQANLADVRLNLGNVYRETGRYDSAAFFLHRAKDYYEKTDYPIGKAGVYTALAALKRAEGDFDSAQVFINQGINFASMIGDHELLLDNLLVLHEVQESRQNYREAAAMLDTIMAVRNKVSLTRRTALVERTKMELDLEDRDNRIKLLETENKLKTQQRNLLLLIGILGAALTLAIVWILLQLRKKNSLLKQRGQELEDLNLVKDKLFSVISHDLRGPFTRIMAILDLVQSGMLTPEEQKEVATQLRLSTAATLSTLDNLLMWGTSQIRKEPPVPEAVSIQELTASSVELYRIMAEDKSIRLVNQITEDHVAWFNKNQLEFIIRNLLANAIKFSNENGAVTIRSQRSDDRILISVEDQGVGMSEAVRERLFRPAEKTISKGTAGESGVGLGLTLIDEFLAKNNGSITVSSIVGKGSVFTINIPAVPAT